MHLKKGTCQSYVLWRWSHHRRTPSGFSLARWLFCVTPAAARDLFQSRCRGRRAAESSRGRRRHSSRPHCRRRPCSLGGKVTCRGRSHICSGMWRRRRRRRWRRPCQAFRPSVVKLTCRRRQTRLMRNIFGSLDSLRVHHFRLLFFPYFSLVVRAAVQWRLNLPQLLLHELKKTRRQI